MTITVLPGLYCTCGTRGQQDGWSNMGTDEEWWVHSKCGRPGRIWLEGTDTAMLNFFKGGPIDGCAYETSVLLGTDALAIPVTEYAWTPEVVTSATTGASARVWVHQTLANGSAASELSSNAAVLPSNGGGSTAANDVTGGHSIMGEATLEERRKALKLSRKQVAAAADLTEAKVYRIEKGGARTTEEETAQLSAALDKLAAADPS